MISDSPLVSFITPVFNGAPYLEALIHSIQTQTGGRIEHIVIDDGSTDQGATAAVLQAHPHLRWKSRTNRGQYATMNEGLEMARGDVVCFVSADDTVLPGAVDAAMDHLRRHPECDGVAGVTRAMDENGNPCPGLPFQSLPPRFYAYFSQISHCSLYLKRSPLLEKELWFDPSLRYVGDYDWMIRVFARLRVGTIHRPLANVRIHTGQASRRNRGKMFMEQQGVVKVRGVNRPGFYLLRSLVILTHDGKKLLHAFSAGGFVGVKKLVLRHFRREA